MLAEMAEPWLPEDVAVLRRGVAEYVGGRPVFSDPVIIAHYAGRLDPLGRAAEETFNRQIVDTADFVATLEHGAAVAPATDLLVVGGVEYEVLGLAAYTDAILPQALVRRA